MIIGIDASRAFVSERTGTEEYSYHLIKHLVGLPAAKQHHFVLYVRPNAIIPDEIVRKNVRILPIKYRYLWTQVGLALATWQDSLDLLFIPAHTLPLLRRPGLRTVVTIHGLEYRWLPAYRNLLQRWYLPLSTYYAAYAATHLIAVSASTKLDLIKETHTTYKKIKVIQEGVESLRAYSRNKKTILERWGLEACKYIIFIGSLQPRKNLPVLVEAFALFLRRHRGYKLVIVGGKGWMSEEIFRAPGRWGVQESVVFTGRVSEKTKLDLLSQAYFYVQPSLTEGFGLPLLEAMALGVPVISSNGGALPEVVGEAGVVVPLGSRFASDLAKVMGTLTAHAKRRRDLIICGRERARELSWHHAAVSTMSLFIRLSSSPTD